jgi:hypothetical protein
MLDLLNLPNCPVHLKHEALRLLNAKTKLRAKADPSVFARYYLKFNPDVWQSDFLQSKSKRIILNCSRQSGKSTTSAILALWEAIYKPNSVIVIDSPSLRQSQELMIKFESFLAMMPDVKTLETDTKLTKLFPNGSRVLALPGSEKTIRGISAVTLFIEDEAALVSDELYMAIRPMLAVSDGRLVLMSTPHGRRGHFHEVWENKDRWGWQAFEIPAQRCSRISKEFLEEERESNFWYPQEFECQFMENEDQLFSDDVIDSIFSVEKTENTIKDSGRDGLAF